MKSIKLTLFFIAVTCVFLSCKKSMGDDEGDCQDDNTTKVTFSNTGNTPLRVVVATSLTSEFAPINPVFTIDLAPGASVAKEFDADEYFNVWYSNCSSNCSMASYNRKTYSQCNEYEEKLGL